MSKKYCTFAPAFAKKQPLSRREPKDGVPDATCKSMIFKFDHYSLEKERATLFFEGAEAPTRFMPHRGIRGGGS